MLRPWGEEDGVQGNYPGCEVADAKVGLKIAPSQHSLRNGISCPTLMTIEPSLHPWDSQ